MEKFQQTKETDSNSSLEVGQEFICSRCRSLEEEESSWQHDGPSKCEQVLSKLRLHYVPSEAESTTILSTIQTELGTVNQDLTRLRSVIERLEARKVELELEFRYQTALLSPIRRLPDEILSEIFLFCSGGRVDVCSPRSDIWQIERVCKRWQDVAISLREVWSSIDVNLGSLTPYKAAIPMATVNHLASLCLQRSGERSLSIRFIEIGITSQFEKIFRLLSSCSNRWANLSFSLSMLETSPEFERGLTRLKSLQLYGNYKGTEPMDAFMQAGRLSQLRLHCISQPLRLLELPWSQIQHFDVSVCNFWPGEFRYMLSLMPNLVNLDSKWNRGMVIGPFPQPAITPVRFRHLRAFVFEASLSDIYTTLQSLYIPAISKLSIHCLNPNASNTHYAYISDAVVESIRCSNCSITTLSLASVDSACVSHILSATPTLVDLELVYIDGIEYNLHELSRPAAVVPRLETFSLTCKGNQGIVAIAPLMEVLRSRSRLQQSTPALKRLDLTLREQRGINYFVRMLGPLSRQLGIQIILHSLAI